MGNFMAYNLIEGNITWAQVQTNFIYKRYIDVCKESLTKKGYRVDDDGNIVPIKSEE